MTILKLPFPSTLFLLFIAGFLSAQDNEPIKIKFGKISQADADLMAVPGDSTAEAYVLFDKLQMDIIQNPSGAPIMKEYRHRRVKLLTEASFGRADVELSYNRDYEKIYQLQAIIHFPDGESTKLRKNDFIRENYDDDYGIYKFTFPGVREGAILEYSYVKSDKNIVVPSRYYFQESIPVRYAEYSAFIPQYFDYISLSSGSNRYSYENVANINRNYGSTNIRHAAICWVMRDLPAYDEQPYVNNFSDYIPQVRMQLKAVSYPNQIVQKVFSSWKESTKDMDDWPGFGKAFDNKVNSNKVFKQVEPLLAGKTMETEMAQVIYDFVTGKITWNGDYSWTADNTPNKLFEAATGSSGEMSVMLLALLRQAGISAQPVLVPLRDGGGPIEIYPLLTQFRHLMVQAKLDGKDVLLDPSTIKRPMGLPRFRALNHRAFVANPDNPHWIDVQGGKANRIVVTEMTLGEDGMADVALKSRLLGYYAVSGRDQLEEMENDNEFPLMEDILEAFPEAEMDKHGVEETEEESGPLNFNMALKIPIGQPIDDFLYVQPIICPVFEKGLADVEQRLYPVDFGYPWQQRYITKIKLPEGYVADELPTSQRLVSPDKTMSCTFAVDDQLPGVISLTFTVNCRKTVYPAAEYATLRNMFKMIIDLQETTLVLKRAK